MSGSALPASLSQIAEADGTNGWKAEQCIRLVCEFTPDDLAVAGLLAAAQVYASLEIAANLDHLSFAYTERNL